MTTATGYRRSQRAFDCRRRRLACERMRRRSDTVAGGFVPLCGSSVRVGWPEAVRGRYYARRMPKLSVGRGDWLPEDYAEFLARLKSRIVAARTRAVLAANSALIELYWGLGHEILQRSARERWGSKVVERLAADLRREFPDMTGLSRRNLLYMRAFAEAWPGLDDGDPPIVQRPVAQLPWGHNIVLLTKLEDADTRTWYAQQAIAQGWSRAVLEAQISTDLRGRQGKALSSFARALPAPDSELVRDAIKDPYHFEFLNLGAEAKERDLELALLDDVQSFLMEMGRGFGAGRQAGPTARGRRGNRPGAGVLPGPAVLQLHSAPLRRHRPEDRGLQSPSSQAR